MKKIFYVMAMVATILAVSCNKEEKPKDKDKGKDQPTEEYVAPIIIDGNLDDWAKLDASKVVTVTCAEGAGKTDLKSIKVYYDQYYLYLYMEYDLDAYDNDFTWIKTNILFNSDNDTATGGYKGDWEQGDTPCFDCLIQGDLWADGFSDLDCSQFKFAGTVNDPEWPAWDDVTVAGFVTSKGTSKGVEISFCRELYPAGKMGEEMTMGVQLCVNGWDSTGSLPNAAEGDAAPLAIKMNK